MCMIQHLAKAGYENNQANRLVAWKIARSDFEDEIQLNWGRVITSCFEKLPISGIMCINGLSQGPELQGFGFWTQLSVDYKGCVIQAFGLCFVSPGV